MRIFSHDIMAKHEVPDGMPEHAGRYHAVRTMLAKDFPDIKVEPCKPASDKDILLAHTPDHLNLIKSNPSMIDSDTYLSPQSYKAALHAAGAAIEATEAVLSGACETAFACVRPPGHHASANQAEGFCLFNNIFIAAKKAVLDNPDLKVLIVDFDVHHGNGTESLLLDHIEHGGENIAYASVHQEGIYPGTGHAQNAFIWNCPLLGGSGSSDFRDSIEYDIIPFAQKFSPNLIMFSAGFDAHRDDPLAGLNYKEEDFAWVVEAFRPICSKMVSVLEGGYNLDTLAQCTSIHLKALANI